MIRNTHDPIRKHIAQRLSSIITQIGGQPPVLSDIHDALVEPPNPDLGDLAFGVFALAKALRKGPPQIASQIKEIIGPDDIIAGVEATGPYLNFKLNLNGLGQQVLEPILSGSMFQRQLIQSTPKTMIEYSQPNTHKELHVGHMRNLCLGDALVRTMKYAGFEVVTSTFPGDVGTHVAKCLWYMKFHNQEPIPTQDRGEWLGRMYSKGHLLLEDQEGTPTEEENRKQLTLILKQLEAKSGEYYDLWRETREWSLELMQNVYTWADVHFDQWYWESDVDAPSLKLMRQFISEGKLVESDGAWGLDLNADGLGFMLLIKRDGTGLYATKDIELARRKFNDVHIERSVYVVDMRQALHFKQVFRALEVLGFPQARDCYHLQYNFVELPDGAMSSRKGNIVPILELIKRMQDKVKEQYLSRYEDWTEAERDLVAGQVAKGAIKYGMARMDQNKKIVFDMNEWLKIEGESGPFVQYSHARIATMLKKLGYDKAGKYDAQLLTHPTEKALLRALMNFNLVVADAAANMRPALICSYVYDLAKRFNLFYHDCPIGTAEPTLKAARLAIAAATGATLKKGLGLIGVPAPVQM